MCPRALPEEDGECGLRAAFRPPFFVPRGGLTDRYLVKRRV